MSQITSRTFPPSWGKVAITKRTNVSATVAAQARLVIIVRTRRRPKHFGCYAFHGNVFGLICVSVNDDDDIRYAPAYLGATVSKVFRSFAAGTLRGRGECSGANVTGRNSGAGGEAIAYF